MSNECETTVMAVAGERNAGRGALNTGLRNVIIRNNGYKTISGGGRDYIFVLRGKTEHRKEDTEHRTEAVNFSNPR